MTDAVEILHKQFYEGRPEEMAGLLGAQIEMRQAAIRRLKREIAYHQEKLADAKLELQRLQNQPLPREDQAVVTARLAEEWAREHP